MAAQGERGEMARDSVAPGQLLLRLGGASRAVVLGAAAPRHHLSLPDEEEPVDADHRDAVAQQALAPTAAEGSSEEMARPDTALLLASSAAVPDFSKEALGRPCKTSSTQDLRDQVMSSMENSTVDDLSYLQDPKAVRLAEKSREIWEVPCRSTNADSHQIGDSNDSDGLVIPVLLKYASGQLALSVNLNQPSQHLMHLYEQKTRMKLDDCQYFVYGRKTLEPDHTLLYYGLERNTTVHACTRLLGGQYTTLAQYVRDNSSTFTVKVTRPDRKKSLQMTEKGCQFLSSWMKCFTTAFSRRRSWNGTITLEDFKYSEGHIRNIRLPKGNCPPGSMANNLTEFVGFLERILCSDEAGLVSRDPAYLRLGFLERILCSDEAGLVSRDPAYLRPFIKFINRIVSRLSVTDVLSSEDKLFLETHVCFMTSNARQRLILELFRKYEGLDINEASDWQKAINGATCAEDWLTDLPGEALFFKHVIDKSKKQRRNICRKI